MAKSLHRWLNEGEAALEPRSRRPAHVPTATPEATRQRVLELRDELTNNGLDAGADTIVWYLTREHLAHNDQATVINADTGAILTDHTLDPARTYQRKNG